MSQCPWSIRGVSVRCPRTTDASREVLVGCSWGVRRVPVRCPWGANGVLVGSPWGVRGVVVAWDVCGVSMGFRGASEGCP